MAGILQPGYLYWNGLTYVLQQAGPPASNVQTGSFTLVDGYATITGSIFINSTSTTKIFITLSESPPVTTAGSTYNVGNLVAGAVGIASFTVGAYHTIVNNQVPEIVINTNDNSTLNYLIVD